MWDADIEREKVLRLGRENAAYEIESNLRGALHPKTLWISDEAKKLRERLFFVRAKLEEADMPYQLLEISEEYQKITGEYRQCRSGRRARCRRHRGRSCRIYIYLSASCFRWQCVRSGNR